MQPATGDRVPPGCPGCVLQLHPRAGTNSRLGGYQVRLSPTRKLILTVGSLVISLRRSDGRMNGSPEARKSCRVVPVPHSHRGQESRITGINAHVHMRYRRSETRSCLWLLHECICSSLQLTGKEINTNCIFPNHWMHQLRFNLRLGNIAGRTYLGRIRQAAAVDRCHRVDAC